MRLRQDVTSVDESSGVLEVLNLVLSMLDDHPLVCIECRNAGDFVTLFVFL
jgi:hypothetical protein